MGVLVRFLVLCLGLLFAGPALAQGTVSFGKGEVRLVTAQGKSHPFTVEVAATDEQRMRGLMFRRQLAPDAGMLFDFNESAPVSMWMKNTFIPLDMLFIAADGRIVDIAERTVPQSLQPLGPAIPVRYVLEVNGGVSARLGLRPGDRVEILR